MNSLKKKYLEEIVPKLEAKFNYENKMAVPQITKITLNVGISSAKKDEKFQDLVMKTLTRISGQKPVFTLAKKAISAFKIREGNVVGAKVTLRANRMYDFLEKLINVSLPRVRDFRGIKKSIVDKQGNLNLGFKEHISFAEIDSAELEMLHGLEISITTNAKNYEEGFELFNLLGFPFQK